MCQHLISKIQYLHILFLVLLICQKSFVHCCVQNALILMIGSSHTNNNTTPSHFSLPIIHFPNEFFVGHLEDDGVAGANTIVRGDMFNMLKLHIAQLELFQITKLHHPQNFL